MPTELLTWIHEHGPMKTMHKSDPVRFIKYHWGLLSYMDRPIQIRISYCKSTYTFECLK